MRRSRSHRFAPALLVLPLGLGCQPTSPGIAPPRAPERRAKAEEPAQSEAESYKLVGVVQGVKPDEGEVTLRHEAIPGYMPAMTMPFALADRSILGELRPGDKVEGTLQVKGDRSDLVDLQITEPAPAPPMTLDTTGGSATLRPKQAALRPGQEVPDFRVTTQDGAALSLSDLRGKVVVLTFIYTRCPLPDYCPAIDRKFAELARMIRAVPKRAGAIRLLSVSFDPEHDTPEVLGKHAKLQGASPPLWTFAVAAHDELRKVAEPLGLMYGPSEGEIAHNLSTAVIGPDGKLAHLAPGRAWTAEQLFRIVHPMLDGDRP